MQQPPMVAVVDDDEFVRTATGSLIRSLGLRVTTYSSAEEFLASSWLDKADCLVTDVQMPGMSGLELQERLQAQGRDLPVIVITAFPEERVRRQAESAGAVGFFAKPYDGQLMVNCIDAALRRTAGSRPE